MARTRNIAWNVVAPLITFVPMSLIAWKLIMGRLSAAEIVKSKERNECPSPWVGKQPYQLQYLGGYVPFVEQILCILVHFFHPLFDSEVTQVIPFLYDFLTSISAPVAVTYLEATRTNHPLLLAFPAVWGILYQIYSGGVIFPIYWAVLITITSMSASDTHIDQASAEAVLFGLVLGFLAPTAAMFHFGSVVPIAIWQVFPVLISVFVYLHLLIRPRRLCASSGHNTVQATYALMFLISTVVHLRAMSAYKFDLRIIADVFVPSLASPHADRGDTSLASIVHLLQWDLFFIFGSTLLASLWFLESVGQCVVCAVWSVVATSILGPGAAVAGVFMWRESKLRQEREQQHSATKLTKTK